MTLAAELHGDIGGTAVRITSYVAIEMQEAYGPGQSNGVITKLHIGIAMMNTG
jgi:hypothetical protein